MRNRKKRISLVDLDRDLSQKHAQCWTMAGFLFVITFGNLFYTLLAGSGLGLFVAILMGLVFYLTLKSALEIRKIRKQLHENPDAFRNKSGEYSMPQFGSIFWLQR